MISTSVREKRQGANERLKVLAGMELAEKPEKEQTHP